MRFKLIIVSEKRLKDYERLGYKIDGNRILPVESGTVGYRERRHERRVARAKAAAEIKAVNSNNWARV